MIIKYNYNILVDMYMLGLSVIDDRSPVCTFINHDIVHLGIHIYNVLL